MENGRGQWSLCNMPTTCGGLHKQRNRRKIKGVEQRGFEF